jgi:hypothetical protein
MSPLDISTFTPLAAAAIITIVLIGTLCSLAVLRMRSRRFTTRVVVLVSSITILALSPFGVDYLTGIMVSLEAGSAAAPIFIDSGPALLVAPIVCSCVVTIIFVKHLTGRADRAPR